MSILNSSFNPIKLKKIQFYQQNYLNPAIPSFSKVFTAIKQRKINWEFERDKCQKTDYVSLIIQNSSFKLIKLKKIQFYHPNHLKPQIPSLSQVLIQPNKDRSIRTLNETNLRKTSGTWTVPQCIWMRWICGACDFPVLS